MSMGIEDRIDLLKNINQNSDPVFFILGPCVIESEKHSLKVAEYLKNLSEKLKFNLIFKSCFDKANRSALQNFRGPGFDDGLKILSKVRSELEIPIITDVHESWQVEPVADVVDVIQIPAFLSRQTDLLIAVGKSKKIINLKKGQFLAPQNIGGAIDKIESSGNQNVWVCERGYTFGYNNLVVDYRNFKIMKQFGKSIVFDATHSVQMPGAQGCSSGGDRTFALPLAASAVAQRIAGIFMEVHDQPEEALCDGPNSIRLSQLEDILKYLIDLDSWIKSHKVPNIS